MAEWLDEAEVIRVIGLQKRIGEDIRWRKRPGYQEFSVGVLSDEADYDMALVGVITEATGYLKFNLFVGPQPITMLHRGKIHHNPDCNRLKGKLHKHRWTDANREKWAYVPDDIDGSTAQTTFAGFLKECNIELEGRFSAPVVQMRIP